MCGGEVGGWAGSKPRSTETSGVVISSPGIKTIESSNRMKNTQPSLSGAPKEEEIRNNDETNATYETINARTRRTAKKN